MIIGYDVSSHQPTNFNAPGDADFLIVKATEGSGPDGYIHPGHDEQVKRARDRGLIIGHYHWLWPDNVKQQARYFLEHADASPGDVLVCDWEQPGTSDHDKNEFIREVKRLAPGHRVLLYCNRNWWEGSDRKAGDGLWMAEYGVSEPGSDVWLIWQHTDDPVDRNKAKFANRDSMRVWAGGKEEPGPPPPKIIHDARVSFRGFTVCGCVATMFPLIEAEGIRRGLIKRSFDIMQGSYNAGGVAASSGTHDAGCFIDIAQHDDETGELFTEYGFMHFIRTQRYGWNGGRHAHTGPQGCPHMSPAAAVQYRDWQKRMNALHPPYRTYEGPWQLLPWRAAFNKHAQRTQHYTPGDDDMALERFSEWRTKDQGLRKPNAWHKLRINEEGWQNVIQGPALITSGTVHVVADGIGPSDHLYVRPYTVDTSGKGKQKRANTGEIIRITTPHGWIRTNFSFDWLLGRDRALRFEWAASTDKAVLKQVNISGTYRPED